MATRNIPASSNPYASGAVVFDSTPYVEYYIREQQKEQAKDEALDKYYQEEMSKISPAGMRADDLPIFNQKFNELKKVWIENKDAIKNPTKYGFEKAQQFNQLKADLMSIPVESKQEKEVEAAVLKVLADPTKRKLVDIPKLSEQMRMQKMPIRTEGRKSVDLANLPFLVEEYTPQERLTYFKNLLSTSGKKGEYGTPIKTGRFTQITPYTEEYSTETLKKIGDAARADALRDGKLEATAKSDFEKSPPEIKLQLDELHRKYYNRPIQGAEDLLAAAAIQFGLLSKEQSQKKETNEEAKFDAAEAGRNMRNLRSAAASQGGTNVVTSGNIIDEIDAGETTLGSGKKVIISQGEVFNSDKTPYNGQIFITRDKLPASLYSALNVMGTDDLFLKGNKGFTAKVVDGQIESLSDERIGRVDRRFLENAQLKLNTEPQKGRQMQFGGNKQQPKQKEVKETKTFVFPKGKTKF